MTTSTLSREAIDDLANAAEFVKIVETKRHRIEPRFDQYHGGLRRGIDDASEQEIALYRPQLAKLGDEIDNCLNNIQGAQVVLERLRADPAVLDAAFDRIEKMVRSVADARRRMTEMATRSREIEAEVTRAIAEIKKSTVAAEADLGALQSQVKFLAKQAREFDAEAVKLEQAARKAWDRKDQKALTEARTNLIDLLSLREFASDMRHRVETFRKRYPDLDRERKAEAQWMLDDIERADDTVARLDKIVKGLMALGQVPKEEKKAAPAPRFGNAEVQKILLALGLPASDAGKRSKALKIVTECPVDQWPRELGKLYGTKESELKGRLGDVRKLPFVKPLTLIDI